MLNKTGKDSRIGGAGNVARNVIAMGAKAFGLSNRNDISGKYLEQIWKKGIGTSAIITENGRTTTVKTRIVGTEHMLRIDEETTDPITYKAKSELKQAIIELLDEEIDVIIVEDYDKGVMDDELANFLIEQTNSGEIAITVDPKLKNFRIHKRVTLFKPNLKELREGLNADMNPSSESSLQAASEALNITY